jgi:Inhibitor of vertebrate lysozyme (Ivy)
MFKPFLLRAMATSCVLLLLSPANAADAKSGRYLHEVIAASQPHQKSLRDMLRSTRSLPPWIRNMVSTPRYVAGASRAVTVDGQLMELFSACLPRHCDDSKIRALFTAEGKAIGLRIEDEKLGIVVLGDVSQMAGNALSTPGL